MKVLFYSINTMMAPVNFAAELDLMKAHLDAGDEVYVLRCTGQLPACHTNRPHFESKCYLCRERFKKGTRLIGFPEANLLTMQNDLDYRHLPEAFNSLEELKAFEFDGVNFGEAVMSSMIQELKDHRFDVHQHAERIHTLLKMSWLVYTNIQKQAEALKPDRVYLFNGRLAETSPALRYCIKNGIEAYTIDRAGTQGRYELFKNVTPLSIAAWRDDFLRLWGEGSPEKAAIGEQYYTDRRKGVVLGDPSYIQRQQKSLLPKGFDPQQKNIGIYITSEYEIAGDPERTNLIYRDQNDGIIKIAESFLNMSKDKRPEYKFWLRAHPNITYVKNLQLLELQEMEARNLPNLGIIWPDSPVDTYALLEACDKIITFGSTVGIEATFWGKPSILAGRAYYEDLDVTHTATSHQQVVDMILDDNLPVKDKLGALIYGHGLMTNGIEYKYFTQTDVYNGYFNAGGKTLDATAKQKLIAYLLKRLDKIREKRNQKALQKTR